MRIITAIAALAVIVSFGGSDAGEPTPTTPTPIAGDISVADTPQTIGAPRSFASLAQ